MVGSGIKRYLTQTAAREEKNAASETSYGSAFVNSHLHTVASCIAERIDLASKNKQVRGAPYWRAVANMDEYTLAFITLRCCIDSSIKQTKLAELTLMIGRRIEDEVRLRQFRAMDEKLFNRSLKKLAQRGATEYSFKLNSLVHTMNHTADGEASGISYFKWPLDTRMQVGISLLDAAISSTGHFIKNTVRVGRKSHTVIELSTELQEWIIHHKDSMSVLFPLWMPMIVPPRDWVGMKEGGFYSPEAQDSCSFAITKPTSNPRAQRKALEGAKLTAVYKAVNTLQKTAWAVNTEVLAVAQQVWELGLGTAMPSTRKTEPPAWTFGDDFDKKNASPEQMAEFEHWKFLASLNYTMEKERIGKCVLVSRILAMAERFKDKPEIFFVWHCDFRGRMYSVASGLAPQSADVGKALIKFANGKGLRDSEGLQWFKVHGANTYGVDKASYADRAKWVDDNSEYLQVVAQDPIEHRKFWGDADKPFQFLAWLFEYKKYCLNPESFVSHLPVGQDGTCNGLQHYSAMLRDSVGGKATNLIRGELPADIYAEVAKVVTEKLSNSTNILALKWLEFGITRSGTKRPVMTLPYGSTQQSCRDYLLQHYLETKREVFEKVDVLNAVNYLSSIVWESIGEVVVAARAAMAWLQNVSSTLAKLGLPLVYTAPSGFVVHQDIKKVKVRRINTVLCGATEVSLGEPTDEIDVRKQRNGIAPNFIHSCDASHLVATINRASDLGITDIAAIHDDYGTYACDSAVFARVIRETFVEQYSTNVLLDLHTELSSRYPEVELPLPPAYGSLDITGVLDSPYFFG
jgi:DNA-directed RNA polymerase, mitochondrial